MVGSMAGHAMYDGISSMMGSGSSAPAEGAAPQQQQQQQQPSGPCQQYMYQFQDCMASTNNDASRCQHIFDAMSQCQRDNPTF